VISRDVDVGQTVAASLQAPTLFTLAEDLSKMEVHTDVAESDVGRVRPGLPVEFSVDAFPGERFRGTVKEVRYSPKTVQNVVTYDAVVQVDNSALKLRPGMTADASFLLEELPDALLVPNAALRFRPPDASGAPASGAGAQPGTGERSGAGAGERSGAGAGERSADGARAGGVPGRPTRPAGEERAGADKADREKEEGRRPAGRRVVWVLDGAGALRSVPIEVGPSDGKNTAVLGGALAEGDRVVVGTAGATRAAAEPSRRPPGPGRFL
jgi:HlyD family secretion protein